MTNYRLLEIAEGQKNSSLPTDRIIVQPKSQNPLTIQNTYFLYTPLPLPCLHIYRGDLY